MKIGLTLPSFVRDIDVALNVARVAQRVGLSGVFAYDHMFRTGDDGVRRPAIECFAMMAAAAAETETIGVGSLVIRASLRPSALVERNLATIAAFAGDRLIIGIGAGDAESVPEHNAFGIAFGDLDTRVAVLRDTARRVQASLDLPVWVAGTHPKVRAVAGDIGALNTWGVDSDTFERFVRELLARNSSAEATWGGLVVLDNSPETAREKAQRLRAPDDAIVGDAVAVARQLRSFRDAGATWCVLAPVDASNAENAKWCAEVQDRLS